MDERRPPKPSNFYRSGVTAKVKWFNPDKGFGFVTPDDGSPEAFLHASALERVGAAELPAGATLVCDLNQGTRGPQVAVIHSIDASTAETRAPRPRRGFPQQVRHAPAAPPLVPAARSAAPFGRHVEGTVKFFDPRKGFGFVVPDRGGKDIFLSAAALRRSGLESLQPQVRVRVTTRQSERGVEAERVEFL